MTDSNAPGAKPTVIRKYANRRLYNTAKSAYVTLDDLSKMVRDGEDFVVRDAKTGAVYSLGMDFAVRNSSGGEEPMPTPMGGNFRSGTTRSTNASVVEPAATRKSSRKRSGYALFARGLRRIGRPRVVQKSGKVMLQMLGNV